MAIYDTHRSTAVPFSSLVADRLVRLVDDLVAWNAARVTHKALSRLSDHELYDIGLERGDIARVSGRF